MLLLARTGGIGIDAASTSREPAAHPGGAQRTSASQLLELERASRRIHTGSPELDKLLNGGVPLRQLTEFAGMPGVGKTQIAIQLALNVQIPHAFGGVGGSAVYIDAEGSFHAMRALQMAEALVQRLRAGAATEAQREAALRLEPGRMLDQIYVYRVHDAIEQLAAIRAAAELQPPPSTTTASSSDPIRLVIVDSVAFHLRHTDMAYLKKQQTMGAMAQGLVGQAVKGGRAAVALNQVTTRVNDALGSSALVPALGETWAHVCGVQLMVAWRDGERIATLYKGLQPGEAVFAVTSEGVRSPHEAAAARHQAAAAAHAHPQQHHHAGQHADVDRYTFTSSGAAAGAIPMAIMPPPAVPHAPPPTSSAHAAPAPHESYTPHHGGTTAATTTSWSNSKRPAERSASYNNSCACGAAAENQPTQQRRY